MAAHMIRPGDRTFFVYDHSVIKKEYDDPKDAIIYYFPQHTSIDVQCTFCNQLMGMVNCTKAIGGAPPKLYKLRKIKVATVHEGNFTLALACKMRTPDAAIIRKLEDLYKVFAFYHCSVTKVKQLSSNNEAFLSNMASIWDFYVPYARRYGNTVPAIFEPVRRVKLLKGGNVFFLRCSHLLQWLKGQPSLLAGCILYKQSVLCTQLTPELTSNLLLIKPNQLHHPSKSVTDTVLPFGVRIMSVYVTQQQYEQLLTPYEPLLKPRPNSFQAKKPEGIFCTPPTSPTKKPESEDQPSMSNQFAPKRILERRLSSKLFSSFTGMLEGSVVESLWPSTPRLSRPSSRSESPRENYKKNNWKDGSPSVMQDGGEAAVAFSRRSDVITTLQGDRGSLERELTRSAPCDLQMASGYQQTSAKRSSNKKNGSASSMQDGGYEVVMLSRSSDDVVKALQDDGGAFEGKLARMSPCDAQVALGYQDISDVSDSMQKPINCPDSLTEPRSSQNNKTVLSRAPPAKTGTTNSEAQDESDPGYAEMDPPHKTACLDDRKNFSEERRLNDSVLEAEAKDTSFEQKVDVEESHVQNDSDVTDISTDCSRKKDLNEEFIFMSSNQLSHPIEPLDVALNLSEPKSESPESGIGDCLAEKRQEDFSGKDPGTAEKENGFVEAEEIGHYSSVDVIGAEDAAPISDGNCHERILCKDSHSDNPAAQTQEDAENTQNAMSDQCLCSDDSKTGVDSSSDVYRVNGNVSLLISKDNADDTQSNVRLNSVDTSNKVNSCGEEKSLGIEDMVKSNQEVVNISGASCGDQNSPPEVSQLNGDVLRSVKDEPGEFPDLLESSQMLELAAEDARRGNSEDVILKYEETEKLPPESSPDCNMEDSVLDVGAGDKLEKEGVLDEEGPSDEDERTILAEDEEFEALIVTKQESLNMDGKSDNKTPTSESRNRFSWNLDTEVQMPQTSEETNLEIPQDLLETVGRPDVQSSEEKPENDEECRVVNPEGPSQEAVQILGVKEFENRDAFDKLPDARQEVSESLEGLTVGNQPEVHKTTSSSSGIWTREDDASLRNNVDEKEGDDHEEVGGATQEDFVESWEGYALERRSSLDGDFSPVQHNTEVVPELVNVSLYVQAHSDTTLLFLAEKSITKEKETLFQLWQSVLRELGELELQLKNVVKPDQEVDCKGPYNFIHFDNEQKLLEGSFSNPVNQAESVFCRESQQIHEQFLSNETLTDVTLRHQQTVVYAHRNACQHTFFHKNHKPSPTPGIPSRDDTAFYIQNSCKEALGEHNINLL